jgi:hypothetical protein
MRTFVVMCLALAAIPASAADSGPVVKVTGRQVRGALLDKGGVVLYEMATGQRPFAGDSRLALLHSIVNQAPELRCGIRPTA